MPVYRYGALLVVSHGLSGLVFPDGQGLGREQLAEWSA